MKKNKQRLNFLAYIPLILFIILLYGFSNVFITKYILINSSWEAYQDLVDINTENENNLINVNYSTLISFIENDTTNLHEYSLSYVCVDFALDLLHNASLQNISSGFVILSYHESQEHAITCFNTTDDGIIYIEPQNDNDITSDITILGKYGVHVIYSISTYWN